MQRSKKSIRSLGLILMSMLCFSVNFPLNSLSSVSANEVNEVVEIDFWSFWGSEPRVNFIQQIVDDFNASQEEIQVNYTFLPWGDIWTKNLASISAGEPADVIINDINAVRQRAQKNQNTNLSEFIAQEDNDFASQFYPQLWEASLYEGEPYAVPFVTDTRILYYNKDIMAEVGLDPETPPTTWQELKEMAQQMDQIEGNRIIRLGYLPRYGIQGDVYYMNATGHGFWDYEANQPIINDPKGVEILDWVLAYENEYADNNLTAFSAEFGGQQADPFMSGKLAMMVKEATHYSQIAQYAPDLNFGVIELPEFAEGYGHTSWGGGFVAEIPYGSDQPEEAWEFIKYLTGLEAQEYWAVNNFDNVANMEAAENAFDNPDLSDKGREVYQVAVENLEQTILAPVPVDLPDLLNIVNPQFDLMYLGEKTPAQALEDAQEQAMTQLEVNQ